MSIKIKLTGFEDLLEKIERAGGSVNNAAETCIKQSADIMKAELVSAMKSATPALDSGLADRIPANRIEVSGNRYTAKVGFKYTNYDPNNPSDYHKAIFANYGTPSRSSHGKEAPRGFIQKAKRSAKRKIKQQQEKTLSDILRELE